MLVNGISPPGGRRVLVLPNGFRPSLRSGLIPINGKSRLLAANEFPSRVTGKHGGLPWSLVPALGVAPNEWRRSSLYVGAVTGDVDIEVSGLLYGLEGKARQDRAELITWLLARGFSMEQIRASGRPPCCCPRIASWVTMAHTSLLARSANRPELNWICYSVSNERPVCRE